MRVGIITASHATVGLGHASRQASVARALAALGHEVSVLTNLWPPEVALPLGCDLHIRPTMDIATVEDHLAELARCACERFVIDLPNSVTARLRTPIENADALGVVSGHGRPAALGVTEVHVGSDLHAPATVSIATAHGRRIAVFGGRNFVLVDGEFSKLGSRDLPREPGHVLVTHGGADPWRLTERTLHALARASQVRKITVVAGSAFDRDIVAMSGSDPQRVTVEHNVRNMAQVMRRASVAVINGGTTRFELCVVGTPFVAIAVNAKQHDLNRSLEDLGVGKALGVANDVSDSSLAGAVDSILADEDARSYMRHRMLGLFDTLGASRVARLVTSNVFPPTPEPATMEVDGLCR